MQQVKQKRLPIPTKSGDRVPAKPSGFVGKGGATEWNGRPVKAGRSGMEFATTRRRGPQTAQQTIPYIEMLRDGICKVREGFYTKSIEYEDINYSVASADDQAAIFDGYCAFLNYFDSALPFQLSFINHRSRPENRYSVNIPPQHDEYDAIRGEYVKMLTGQIAKSNNGIVRSKYITFGIQADGIGAARPRLERVEADIMSNFKKLGVQSRPLTGRERLEVLHGQLHPNSREPFVFSWSDIPKTGMGTKDFIAPTSFDFRQGRAFRVGSTTWGAVSYMQILASELSDKLLAELLEMDAEMTVTLHIQTVDQTKAIKALKGKISDIDKMKVEEQKKAVRAGYDMDILPPDLVTFSKDAMTEDEFNTIHQRMAEAGITNTGAYIRKMALNGYVLNVDLAPIRELVSLQRRCANNLNQVAIHANTYGVYPSEITALQKDYAELWGRMSDVLKQLTAIVEI